VNELRLILISPEPLLCVEFREQFKELPNVAVVDGCFETLPEFDCLVSPANSFGLMDGGMDAAITCFFGDALQNRVQQRILAE
jgi:O-acetyl-ADP-ribose deacetylase (regulator of RNase III)